MNVEITKRKRLGKLPFKSHNPLIIRLKAIVFEVYIRKWPAIAIGINNAISSAIFGAFSPFIFSSKIRYNQC